MALTTGQEDGPRIWTTWLPSDLRANVEAEEAKRWELVAGGLVHDAGGPDPHAILKHLPLFNK